MKISTSWLKELVDLKISMDELVNLLPLRIVGVKEVTKDFIELDMKGYNRPDLLSMRGVALEVAAITGSTIKFYEQPGYPKTGNKLNVKVEDEKLCPVYCLAKIENLKVEDSSDTWVKKLNDCGIRSVNNLTDITNIVMLEYGQPLHAFDEHKVRGSVKVRVARKGEKITTLDNKKRQLTEADLLITDDAEPIAIAGIMGGKDSEISENTTSMLLEAAIFNPVAIRKTASHLGLQSEASKRFYHGLTKKRLLQAFNAAIKIYESLGGKLTAISIVGNSEDKPKTIKLSQEKINSLIGIEIPAEEVESSLKKLGFKLETIHLEGEEMRLHLRGGINWDVTVPYWRLDIEIEEDLIEEVARMYGYEKIPAKALGANIPDHTQNPLLGLLSSLKQTLSGLGLTEVQTYSYYSSMVLNNLDLDKNSLIKIANPMSAETEYLRDNLWPNLLEVAAKNIRQGYKDIAIFEIGKVYAPQKGDLPKENYHLSIAVSNGTDNPIQELYQLTQRLGLHPKGVIGGLQLNPRKYFHPTRYTDGIAEIHPRFVNKFGIEQRVAVLEIKQVITLL